MKFVTGCLVIAFIVCLIVIIWQSMIISEDRMWLKGRENTIVNLFEEKDAMVDKNQEELKSKDKIIAEKEGNKFGLECELRIAKESCERADAAHFRHHGLR